MNVKSHLNVKYFNAISEHLSTEQKGPVALAFSGWLQRQGGPLGWSKVTHQCETVVSLGQNGWAPSLPDWPKRCHLDWAQLGFVTNGCCPIQ